jgi:CDP-2,3-bis-(O-geranylgeranyl)-sn-glycerol synthase
LELRAVFLAAAQTLYLFAPLLVSAAISGIVLRFDLAPKLRRPIDMGATFRGHRVFGDSKTWRGVVVAVAGSIATAFLQRALRGDVPAWLQVLDYGRSSPFWLGLAMGAGAMAGELPNSFVKRQLGIPPGKTTRGWRRSVFYVWDQIDLLTGAWPLLLFWVRPPALLVGVSFVVALAVHPLVALVGYLIGARKSAR